MRRRYDHPDYHKRGFHHRRFGLSIFFSFAVFSVLLVTAFIIAAISYFFLKQNNVEFLESHSGFVIILSVLLSSIILGTVVSPLMGHIALRPIRKVIAAINQLADGDFSTRLTLGGPPEVRELAASFNRMAEELGGIELLRTDFVNNFSHEFKTPIVSIKGFAEMLKYVDLTQEERDEYLDIVISESSRLAALATNVLNLSKVENQTILTDRHMVELGEQIRRCILILEPKWGKKNIDFSVNVQDIRFFGNEELLSQVWLNLLDNAVKFTPKCGEIEVALSQENDNVKFTLRDNGAGIDSDSAAHIFDKFYQADKSHTTSGNGLGLTLARKIVELHGGSVTCESEPGKGTVFIVLLPKK